MPCPCNAPATSDSVIACQQSVAVFDESAVSVYADRVGAQGGTGNWVRCLAIICLRTNRLLYAKQTPGDCGTVTGSGKNVGAALAVTGLKAGLGAIPLVGGFLAQIANFLPFAHHAQAVANEQATLCDVSLNWAGFAAAMEDGLRTRQIGLQDAVTRLDKFHQDFTAELATVSQPINAGYGYMKALDALTLFNKEAVYPSLVPGVVQSIISSVTGSKTGTGALVIGGGVVGAKLLGVL